MGIRAVSHLGIAAVVAALSIAAVLASGAPFNSPDGDFRVTFPADPVRTDEDGTAEWNAGKDQLQYGVIRRQLKQVTTASQRLEVYEAVITTMKASGYTVLQRDRLTISGRSTLRVRMVGSNDRSRWSEIYLAGGRIYLLSVVGPRGTDTVEPAREFFGSFQILFEQAN
jgi:hypothetical protein